MCSPRLFQAEGSLVGLELLPSLTHCTCQLWALTMAPPPPSPCAPGSPPIVWFELKRAIELQLQRVCSASSGPLFRKQLQQGPSAQLDQGPAEALREQKGSGPTPKRAPLDQKHVLASHTTPVGHKPQPRPSSAQSSPCLTRRLGPSAQPAMPHGAPRLPLHCALFHQGHGTQAPLHASSDSFAQACSEEL